MRERIKWILVGLGFTIGLQVIISLVFTAILFNTAQSESDLLAGPLLLPFFGFSLGAFLVGGFLVGWMREELSISQALVVAVLALAVCALIYMALPPDHRIQFVAGNWLADSTMHLAFTGRSILFVALSLAAAAAGAYWGWHVSVPEESSLDRVVLLLGLVGAIVGPFILLAISGRDPSRPDQPNLPWYFLVIVLILLIAIVGVGFFMFTRESHYDEEISISPEHHKDEEMRGEGVKG